jgi:hypothetical protein
VEHHKTDDVDGKTKHRHDNDADRVADFWLRVSTFLPQHNHKKHTWWIEKALQSFKCDKETHGNKKAAVHQSSQHFRSTVTVRHSIIASTASILPTLNQSSQSLENSKSTNAQHVHRCQHTD